MIPHPGKLNVFRDVDGNPIQPYYAAYMLAHGMERPLVGSQWPFMCWIEEQWRDSGVQQDPADHEAFKAYLETIVEEASYVECNIRRNTP